jgi:hypothetical protein
MMFPAVPWFGYLALSGLKGLVEKSAPRYSAGAVWTLIVLIAIPYGQFYRKQDFGPIRETAGLPEFNQLCQAVRENTGPEDSILYIRARALSLYTGRPASAPNYRGSPAELWQWAANIHARYFLITNAFNDDQDSWPASLRAMQDVSTWSTRMRTSDSTAFVRSGRVR